MKYKLLTASYPSSTIAVDISSLIDLTYDFISLFKIILFLYEGYFLVHLIVSLATTEDSVCSLVEVLCYSESASALSSKTSSVKAHTLHTVGDGPPR